MIAPDVEMPLLPETVEVEIVETLVEATKVTGKAAEKRKEVEKFDEPETEVIRSRFKNKLNPSRLARLYYWDLIGHNCYFPNHLFRDRENDRRRRVFQLAKNHPIPRFVSEKRALLCALKCLNNNLAKPVVCLTVCIRSIWPIELA